MDDIISAIISINALLNGRTVEEMPFEMEPDSQRSERAVSRRWTGPALEKLGTETNMPERSPSRLSDGGALKYGGTVRNRLLSDAFPASHWLYLGGGGLRGRLKRVSELDDKQSISRVITPLIPPHVRPHRKHSMRFKGCRAAASSKAGNERV
ncbi:hypothetical protein MHYP_G00230720 [Metynnis hypsauchen]